jgi:hypothetical protein
MQLQCAAVARAHAHQSKNSRKLTATFWTALAWFLRPWRVVQLFSRNKNGIISGLTSYNDEMMAREQ